MTSKHKIKEIVSAGGSRRIWQFVFAGGFTLLLLSQSRFETRFSAFTFLGYLDPLTGLARILHAPWSWFILLSILALAASVLRGRVFCGWVCPVGSALDLIASGKRLIRRPGWQPSSKARLVLLYLRWILLGTVVGLLLLGHSWVLFINPFTIWAREVHRMAIGHLLPWSFLLLVLLGLIGPARFWCRFFCPTGSLLGLAARLGVGVRGAKTGRDCRGCGLCAPRCTLGNISVTSKGVRLDADCLGCGECVRVCPGQQWAKVRLPVRVDQERRALLTGVAAGLGMLATGGIALPTKPVSGALPRGRPLRPPGALREEDFVAACNRCGQCMSACPAKVLIPVGLGAGLGGFWTPSFAPWLGHCTLCAACDRVCPTGALAVVPREKMRLGTAVINKNKCYGWLEGGGLCFLGDCPYSAVYFDEVHRAYIDERKCVGCGVCVRVCPGAAVEVVPRGEIRRR